MFRSHPAEIATGHDRLPNNKNVHQSAYVSQAKSVSNVYSATVLHSCIARTNIQAPSPAHGLT